MKNKIIQSFIVTALVFSSCQKADFEESYADPSKISQTTVEKQFTGFLNANKWYVLPDYWNYFVVLRTSLHCYNQAIGWVNADNQYLPPTSGLNSRWDNYYGFLAQFRELEKVYSRLSTDDQATWRIYMIAANIYLYDHTQRVVDLHGDIPFSEAGKLSVNGGDYEKSYAKYDGAEAIYTKMLDDLKGFSEELNNIRLNPAIQAGFKTQDFINKGDINTWKRYCNSLRLRMLTRVSNAPALKSRAGTEIAAILGDATKYPVISSNAENVQINVFDINTDIHSKGFRSGLEDWNGNVAGKEMIDHMKANKDARLRAMFEPGTADTAKVYKGLDPMLQGAEQSALVAGGTLSIYNRSTFSRNQFFPGILFNAAEVSLLQAEYYLRSGSDAAAKAAYEKAIKQSTEFYYAVRKLSNDNTAPALTPYTDAEVTAYTQSAGVNWDTPGADKMALIATQKWIHFNVVQPVDSWSEIRRLGLPKFNFRNDDANAQKQPPYRWFYPISESIYNTANYEAVRSNDLLNKKIFWN